MFKRPFAFSGKVRDEEINFVILAIVFMFYSSMFCIRKRIGFMFVR